MGGALVVGSVMMLLSRSCSIPRNWWTGLGSAGVERATQERRRLVDRASGRHGLAEWIEQHEIVDRAVIAHGRDGYAGGAHLGRVGLAFIAQHVGFVDEDQ